jgi:sodium/potassium-transporting ATPase subunit alpha
MGWGSNKLLLAGVILALAIIVSLIYFPPLARAFDNQVIPLVFWLLLISYAPILYTLEWFRKAIIRRMEKKQA